MALKLGNPQVHEGFMVPYVVAETKADGSFDPPAPGDNCVLVSSDPSSALVVPDATPSVPDSIQTGFIQGLKAAPGITLTETVSHADGTNFPPVVDTIDVIPAAATGTVFTLGAEVPIGAAARRR